MSEVQYDEPGSRTRQAWLRSALGMVAVTLLIERGLYVRGMPLLLGLAALVPAAAFVALAVLRSIALGPHHAKGVGRAGVLVPAAAVILLAATAAASVLGAA